MTAWRDMPNSEFAQDAALKTETGVAFRDNPIAIAEGSTDAPYVQAAWHPYDGVIIGDGNNGLIYDFSVDGSVASVTTPDFEDGYEYKLYVDRVAQTNISNGAVSMDLYKETDAAYQGLLEDLTDDWDSGGGNGFSAEITIHHPRLSKHKHIVSWVRGKTGSTSETSGADGAGASEVYDGTEQKILRARLNLPGTKNAGKVFMFRRMTFL